MYQLDSHYVSQSHKNVCKEHGSGMANNGPSVYVLLLPQQTIYDNDQEKEKWWREHTHAQK